MRTENAIIIDFAKDLNQAFLRGIVCRECKTPIDRPHVGLCEACTDRFEILRPYVRELNVVSPAPSYSHNTLASLNFEHGTETIDKLLREYWATFGHSGELDNNL